LSVFGTNSGKAVLSLEYEDCLHKNKWQNEEDLFMVKGNIEPLVQSPG